MELDGALKLENGKFKILIRDITYNLELPFQINESLEATRKDSAVNCQLAFEFNNAVETINAPREAQVNYSDRTPLEIVECQHRAKVPQFALRRQRFTYAHELCHTFFFDLKAEIPHRPYSYLRGTSDPIEEGLCNLGASLLLMPDEIARCYFGDQTLNSERLHKFCSDLDVSFQSAVVRLGLCDCMIDNKTIVVLSSYSYNRFTGRDKKFRIRASVVPLHLRSRVFIPENAGADHLKLRSLNNFYKSRFDRKIHKSEVSFQSLDIPGLSCQVESIHERIPESDNLIVSYI